MTRGPDTPMEHPDELLAGYVDGSASSEERRAVEAHLADCTQCRDEVALASTARAALMTLPEVEAPGLTARGLEGLQRGDEELVGVGAGDELAARREARREDARGFRRWRISWAALAGAAAVLAVLAVVPLVLSRGGGDLQTGGPTPESGAAFAPDLAKRYPDVVDLGSNHDQASIRSLAERLGAQASGKKATGPSSLSGDSSGRAAEVAATEVVRCVLEATGLPPETIPVYLEVATYRGTPAYVAAVQTEGAARGHLRVYTVSRQDCTFLFLADQPL